MVPNDPPPDRVFVGAPGSSPVECRFVTKLSFTLDPEAGETYRAELEELLAEELDCEVSVVLGG